MKSLDKSCKETLSNTIGGCPPAAQWSLKSKTDSEITSSQRGQRSFIHSRGGWQSLGRQSPESLRDTQLSNEMFQDSMADSEEKKKLFHRSPNFSTSFRGRWQSSNLRNLDSNFIRDWQPSDRFSKKPSIDFRGDGQRFNDMRSRTFADSGSGRQPSDNKDLGNLTDFRKEWRPPPSKRGWGSSDTKDSLSMINSRKDWQQSDLRNLDSSTISRRDWQQSDCRYQDSSTDSRGDWQQSDQRYQDSTTDSRRDWQQSEQRYNDSTSDSKREWQQSDQRYHVSSIDSWQDWQYSDQRFPKTLTDPRHDRQHSDQRFQKTSIGRRQDWQHPDIKGRFSPANHLTPVASNTFQGYKSECPPEQTWNSRATFQSPAKFLPNSSSAYEPDNKRFRLDPPPPMPVLNSTLDNFSSGASTSESGSNQPVQEKLKTFNKYQNCKRRISQNVPKEKPPKKWEKAMIEDAPRYTVLFQYLQNFKQPLEENDVEHVKKHVMQQYEEDKIKKAQRKWHPIFLHFSSREHGLAIVCEDQRSMTWLLKRKIPSVDGRLFVACNALTPIKNEKLNFHITNCTDAPEVVLSTLDKFNRWVNFRQFRVLSYSNNGGNVAMDVLTDSRTITKIEKINWMARYGEHRKVRLYKCNKSDEDNKNDGGNIDADNNEEDETNCDNIDIDEEDYCQASD